MDCPELPGYGDGGGPCEYTYGNFSRWIDRRLTELQPLIEITTYLQPLLVSPQRRLQQSSRNSPEDDEQQP